MKLSRMILFRITLFRSEMSIDISDYSHFVCLHMMEAYLYNNNNNNNDNRMVNNCI